jgi:hypothetical protein
MARFIILRTNKSGQQYRITQEARRKVSRIETNGKHIEVNATVTDLNQAWFNWYVKGNLIQDAFPFLNADEREFIMTGTTKTEWDKMWDNIESKTDGQ